MKFLVLKSPLSQFDIITLFPLNWNNLDISITNLTINLFIVFIIGYFLLYRIFPGKFIPKMWQLIMENLFIFIFRLVYQQIGKSGLVYFPFLFALFTWILFLNLLSMMPYAFAVTSHMVWTIYFSLSICLGIFILGILKHKIYFFRLFIPEVPFLLYPVMILIEILSYILRSFSLAIRLSANIIAGHTLVHILADFVGYLSIKKFILVIFPFFLLLAIFVLEFGVACLQAYIFIILTCMYLNEAINLNSH